ncbi:hypothetical protein RFI_15423, partial [Reticulomyxa filosa]
KKKKKKKKKKKREWVLLAISPLFEGETNELVRAYRWIFIGQLDKAYAEIESWNKYDKTTLNALATAFHHFPFSQPINGTRNANLFETLDSSHRNDVDPFFSILIGRSSVLKDICANIAENTPKEMRVKQNMWLCYVLSVMLYDASFYENRRTFEMLLERKNLRRFSFGNPGSVDGLFKLCLQKQYDTVLEYCADVFPFWFTPHLAYLLYLKPVHFFIFFIFFGCSR